MPNNIDDALLNNATSQKSEGSEPDAAEAASAPVKRGRGRPRKNPSAPTGGYASSSAASSGLGSSDGPFMGSMIPEDGNSEDESLLSGRAPSEFARRRYVMMKNSTSDSSRSRSRAGRRWAYIDPVAGPARAAGTECRPDRAGSSLHEVLAAIRPDDFVSEMHGSSDTVLEAAAEGNDREESHKAFAAVISQMIPEDMCVAPDHHNEQNTAVESSLQFARVINAIRNEELNFSPELSLERAARAQAHASAGFFLEGISGSGSLPVTADRAAAAAAAAAGAEAAVAGSIAGDEAGAAGGLAAEFGDDGRDESESEEPSAASVARAIWSESHDYPKDVYGHESLITPGVRYEPDSDGLPGRTGLQAAVAAAADRAADDAAGADLSGQGYGDDVGLSFNEDSVTDYESDKERWLSSLKNIDSASLRASEHRPYDAIAQQDVQCASAGAAAAAAGSSGPSELLTAVAVAGDTSDGRDALPIYTAAQLSPEDYEYHEGFMKLAMEQAMQAYALNEVPVGAVVVSPDGDVIGRGFNMSIINNDPSAHAEIIAIRDAGNNLSNYRLIDCTLYVTLEPCCMCAMACIHARLGQVIYAAYDAKTGACGSVFNLINSRLHNHQIRVTGGVCEQESAAMISRFFSELRKKKKQLARQARQAFEADMADGSE